MVFGLFMECFGVLNVLVESWCFYTTNPMLGSLEKPISPRHVTLVKNVPRLPGNKPLGLQG